MYIPQSRMTHASRAKRQGSHAVVANNGKLDGELMLSV